MTARTCGGSTKDGQPCRVRPLVGSDPPRCFNHAEGEAAAARRKAARSTGGKVKARTAAPVAVDLLDDDELEFPGADLITCRDCEAALAHIAREVIAGRLRSREAAAAVAAIRPILAQAIAWGRL